MPIKPLSNLRLHNSMLPVFKGLSSFLLKGNLKLEQDGGFESAKVITLYQADASELLEKNENIFLLYLY